MTHRSPFRCSQMCPGVIRLAVMLHVRVPLPARNVVDCSMSVGSIGPWDGAAFLRQTGVVRSSCAWSACPQSLVLAQAKEH